MVLRLTTRIQKELNRGSGGGDHQSNQHGIGQGGADTFQGGSDKSEVADFLNSWNRLGRARPKTSDASRQRRQRSGIPAMNSNRRRGTNNNDLVTEDLMIISMSPISIKPRSKDDIFRLGDFDKHVTPANSNNAQLIDDNNSTQLPPFGGYPSLSGDSSKQNFYYGKKSEPSGNQGKSRNTVLHKKLLYTHKRSDFTHDKSNSRQ